MTLTDHPHQISLPGQTHVAEGPHDQTGMYVMHHAFRRDLARLESAVRHTPLGDADVWRLLDRHWRRFSEALHHHHQIEDAAFWPAMLHAVDAAGDTVGRATLEAMEAEHGHIDPTLSACGHAFTAMVECPCADHRNALDVLVTEAHAALLHHLRHEETEALPLLQRTLTVEEYAACEKAAAQGYPLRMIPFLLAWTNDDVPEDISRRIMPAGLWLVLLVVRPTYRRRTRATFRYA